ncbi:MAG: nicotinate (nicotinamide) nucleotide adenylyltransferase [Phycisphaerales bacterium]|nr:nicotinate (nicotinamide) nucleotide adenylyltransferase [Phycisphaerales bacterium]
MRKIILYGGSFDPIHIGHLISARAAAERIRAERIVLIPTHIPPHKRGQALASVAHRTAMCRLATEGDALFDTSDWEATQPGPSYSLHTVEHFRGRFPDSEMYFLVGMDALAELHSWFEIARLADLCTFVTARRPDCSAFHRDSLAQALTAEQIRRIEAHIIDSPMIDIRATNIRERAANRQSIRYLVPESVRAYIELNQLYRS